MAEQKYLFENLKEKAYDYEITKPAVPAYIIENIKFDLFQWQQQALVNFLTYQLIKEKEENLNPTHLLFNMATGTGKTLLMASLILYYYQQGYRHFIFFVNQNNIVGKTEDNLTNPDHTKYLFGNPIVLDDKTVQVRKVDTFTDDTDDIEILFTSIHKLHNAVYQVRENSVFLEDLQRRQLVMLGDEAHHLNAATKKAKNGQEELDLVTELKDNASQKDVEKSWEHTVLNLLLKRGKTVQIEPNPNVLLEFTATVPTDASVVQKYKDKTIHRFDLKDFLQAGYTKEINLVTSSYNKKQRVLQALLFNWYRHHIALKHGIPNFKPVILFRSKFVTDEQTENSRADYTFFLELVQNLSSDDFAFLGDIKEEGLFKVTEVYYKGQSRIIDIRRYIEENNISFSHIIEYLQYTFQERNCIITNSKEGTKTKEKTDEETEQLLNSLEDKNNHITAIFTVQRLTEGWDVLNLFDIVRMYQGRDEGQNTKGERKAGKSTISEVQLIGRGVRYYPFAYADEDKRKRKFDRDLNHELRVLEEFYFHSDNDEKYISELKKELKRQELLPEQEKVQKTFDFKDSFKESPFYKEVKLFVNEQVKNPESCKRALHELTDFEFNYTIPAILQSEARLKLEGDEDEIRYKTKSGDKKTLSLTVNDFEKHLVWKALNIQAKKDKSLFRFPNLRQELAINSVKEILEERFAGNFAIKVIVPGERIRGGTAFAKHKDYLQLIEPAMQLDLLLRFFDQVSKELKEISNPYIGTDFKAVSLKKLYSEPKTISVVEDPESVEIAREVSEKGWYVLKEYYGTSEERSLMTFLKNTMENFKEAYEQVYLLRNEQVYKVYDFEKGRGFMPDFLLFLKKQEQEVYYQVFIEPKGGQFKDASGGFKDSKEGWKEKFLEDITTKYAGKTILKAENREYKLVGLPLYNAKTTKAFKDKIKEHLEVEV